MSASAGVAAPVGAVSRKDRERAATTSLRRDGTSVVLRTALPGSVTLQRRAADGTWETLDERRASLRRRTRLELPAAAASSSQDFRVVFSPKNANIASWVSESIDG